MNDSPTFAQEYPQRWVVALVASLTSGNPRYSTAWWRAARHRPDIQTTRDRLVGEVEWRRRTFDLIDTGGLAEPTTVEGSGKYMDRIRDQVESAIAAADLLLFVVDAKAGITAADVEVSQMLRRSGRQTLLIANKADNQRREIAATEFYELGLGEPLPTSATNGAGGEVLDIIDERLPRCELPELKAVRRRHHQPAGRHKSAPNAILGENASVSGSRYYTRSTRRVRRCT
jgi:GTP-binding protein